MADENSTNKVNTNAQMNRLRAAVLGANDGIVSVSSIILGVAGATSSRGIIFTAGLTGLVAGAFSMGVGEYVSVSSQRDTERIYIAREKRRLRDYPEEEFEELAFIYKAKGLTTRTAHTVAKELTAHDAVRAHLEAEFNLDEDDLFDPWQASVASVAAFTIGGLIPLLAVSLSKASIRVGVTFVAVIIALTVTGYLSATAGGASRRHAIWRVVVGGALAMIATYIVGRLFGTTVG